MDDVLHKPVLLNEVLGFFSPNPGGVYVDATIGTGGHAERILEESAPSGRLLGIEIDNKLLEIARKRLERFKERCTLVDDNYRNLEQILHGYNINKVDGILFDLGVNIEHFSNADRGFSINKDGPLDMRFTAKEVLTAEEIINKWRPDNLINLFYKYGEERHARRIVKCIVEERKKKRITRTSELTGIILRAIGRKSWHKTHPATKVFQALRIAVNNELDNIYNTLPIAVNLLKDGGRICVISFHSLEDRIVKNMFRSFSGSKIKIITKKPVIASGEEVAKNPRSRSAKLRVAERIYAQDQCI